MNWKNKLDEALSQISEDALLAHETRMVQFRFLSEIDRLMDERNFSKKELAKAIGTSPSYITQLFKGTKPLNLETIAKFQKIFGVKFDVEAKLLVDKYRRETPEQEFTPSYTENLQGFWISRFVSFSDADTLACYNPLVLPQSEADVEYPQSA